MSPAPENDFPRTPERKTSASHIFAAFRSLTSSRPSTSSQPTALPPALTPLQSGYTRDVRYPRNETLNQRSFSDNGSASTASRAASEDALSGMAPSISNVFGGPPELGKLLLQLDKSRPLQERVQAARSVSAILGQYKISNPLAIWEVGEDLMNSDSDDASVAGISLLVGCAKTGELTAVQRDALFRSLLNSDADGRDLYLRLDALKAMTNNGRNVESIEQELLPFVARMMRSAFEAIHRERKQKRTNGTGPQQALNGTFNFLLDVTKFNAKVLDESDLQLVVTSVIEVCQKTTAERDINNSIDVVIALLTFTQVPASSIHECLELLANVYKQVVALKEQTWEALTQIFRSHLGHTAVLRYLDMIENTATGSSRMAARGALRILCRLVEEKGDSGLPQLQLSLLMAAIDKGFASRDVYYAQDVLTHFSVLLFEDDLRMILQNEADWDVFVRNMLNCFDVLKLDMFKSTAEASQDDQSVRSSSTSPSERSERTATSARSASASRRGRAKDFIDMVQACKYALGITLRLTSDLPRLDLLHKDAVIRLLLRLGRRLNNPTAEVLITCCAEDKLLLPASARWLDISKRLIEDFLHDTERPTHLRIMVINSVGAAYATAELVSAEAASELALATICKMDSETDGIVLDALAGFAALAVERSDAQLFDSIIAVFERTIFQRRTSNAVAANLSPLGGFPIGLPAQVEPSLCRTAAKHVIRMFIRGINRSAKRAESLFAFILKVAASKDCALDARICALKLLFRLRATSNYAIYIRPLPESERIAAVLCRTAETANWTVPSADSTARDSRAVSTGSAGQGGPKHKSFDVKRPVPPLWFYPGPRGLPEEPSPDSSMFVFSHQEKNSETRRENTGVLKLGFWLETIISLLQQPDTDWEIYSYLIVHLGMQLANQNLFRDCIPQVKFLRNVVCEQIRASSFHEPPSYTSLKKADVAVCLFHILTMLVGYHDHFARSEEDEVVRTFILGIGSWDRTSKWCIHALSVCCHELPLSVSKMLDTLVQKMSQIITQSQIAIHILEFLVMVARLPDLYKNFREDEYKMVFGVSFRYLQYVREKQERSKEKDVLHTPAKSSKMRHSDSFKELRMLNDNDTRPRRLANGDDLPQYVYALAFHVITFWFMNLKLEDRPVYMPWISKNLTYQTTEGRDIVEDQGLVTMDMMEKVAYTDRDETAHDPNFAMEVDGEVAKRSWIIGYSLLTIETAGRTGLSQVTRRRPSGTKYSIFKPSLTSPPRHQVPLTTGVAADAFYTSSYIGVLPEDIIQEFYSSYNLVDTKSPRPIPLPDDEAVNRAIITFDRNSTVDGHKVGVIYIGEGQTNEAEILANSHGSADYTTFIGNLGFLTRLKGATFNSQGLDRSDDMDGQYTYCWRDRATELVFHITTMMPTNLEHDATCVAKKSHIGNDFVNIVWNESGKDFNFDTFPSQFNLVYVVITPESSHSFTTLRDKEQPPSLFYKVQVVSAEGFPDTSPAAETKVLSAKALPEFVRLLALNAAVLSLVWHNREGGEHVSPWRNRLREIKRLRERYIHNEGTRLGYSSSPAGGANKFLPPTTMEKTQNEALASGALVSPPQGKERGGSALSNRISLATFSGSEDLSRSSLTTSSAGDRGGHDSDRDR